MRFLAPFLPAVTITMLVFFAVLPWGTSESMHFFLPLLPMIGIHYWVVRRSRLVPVLFVFSCGLAMDVLTNGPLGIWSFIYLIGYIAASFLRDIRITHSVIGRWIGFTLCMGFVAAVEWAISSLYFARALDWRPLAIAVAMTVLAYPVLAIVFWPISRVGSKDAIGSLTRGA